MFNFILQSTFLKYLPKGYETEKLYNQREATFGNAANILITHGHLDHLSSVMSLYKNKPCAIYLTDTPAMTLTKQGFPEAKIRRIAPGDVLRFPGISVCVYQGKHIRFDAKLVLQKTFSLNSWRHFSRLIHLLQLNMQYKEKNEIVFYEIQGEGKRIQIMGSADLADEVEYPTEADALILPHQGRTDIDSHNEAIIRKLNPKRVLLNHYDDAFPPISEQVPVDAFCQKMSVTVPTENMIEGRQIEI
ncbi:MAG: MBL fold metallo-hydrolase [Oscillospiraceae bacterium]|nr:MBL fold metallo-hydrolase [Oscillospiraceae bacterium]